mmetsp:Transcript_15365/g.43919  ORF Transcript_15365/g.43919 Transcript_15365/m.43919 type:complete len:205 (+) Transcript_15365:838-1452(+)
MKRSSNRNVRLDIAAGRVLRRSLYKSCPSDVWKILTTVPFSDAVATSEPDAFNAKAARAVWCAVKTCVARSSCPTCTRTAPMDWPGQQRIHGSLSAASTQRPRVLAFVVRCRMTRSLSHVYTYIAYSQTMAMMSLLKATPFTSFLDLNSPTNFPFWSSQIWTLFRPPLEGSSSVMVTMANMLVLNNIAIRTTDLCWNARECSRL